MSLQRGLISIAKPSRAAAFTRILYPLHLDTSSDGWMVAHNSPCGYLCPPHSIVRRVRTNAG